MPESLGLVTEVYSPDNLLAGHDGIRTESITLLSGQNCARGTLLGKIAKSTPATGTPGGGNTGNGTISGVVAGLKAKIGTYRIACVSKSGGNLTVPATGVPGGGNSGNGTVSGVSGVAGGVKAGTYQLTCIAAAADGGIFQVADPDGYLLPQATVGVAYASSQINLTINDGSADFAVGDTFTIQVTDGGRFSVKDPDGNSLPDAVIGAYANEQINFVLADSSTDFVIGDYFTITVGAGSGKYIKSLAIAVDGSQDEENMAILARDTDASAGDIVTSAYLAGPFNENALTYGTGHSAASVKHDLARRGIFLKSPVIAN